MFKFKLNARNISFLALLLASEIVLSRFCSINTNGIKIGFNFVPKVLCAMCVGPVPCAVVCALSDFLGAMLFPFGPYHPGFTATAFVSGFIYGLLMYNLPKYSKAQIMLRVTLAVLIGSLAIGLCINTVWVSQLYGSKTYAGWFLYRIPEYFVAVPTQIIITPALVPLARYILSKYRIA